MFAAWGGPVLEWQCSVRVRWDVAILELPSLDICNAGDAVLGKSQ